MIYVFLEKLGLNVQILFFVLAGIKLYGNQLMMFDIFIALSIFGGCVYYASRYTNKRLQFVVKVLEKHQQENSEKH